MNCPECGVIYEPTAETLLGFYDTDWLERKFPGVDLELEAEKCASWHGAQRKKPKSLGVALLNWLGKAARDLPQTNGTGPSLVKKGSRFY